MNTRNIITLLLTTTISCTKTLNKDPKYEILSSAELPVNILDHPDNFFVKDADYNPSLFGKFTASLQQAATLESQLRSKKLLKLRSGCPPREVKSWWNPTEDALSFSYMTTINSPVNIIISSGNEKKEVYIWVSSP